MPASILLTCACESVLLLNSSAWFMPSSFLRLRIKMPIPVDCFIIDSSLLFQLSVQPVIVYAKSKFADDCRSAENQQQDGLHGIASFFSFLVSCCGIAPHSKTAETKQTMLPVGDSCHGVAPCIVQRLLISAGHSDASQLCGDPLTAKRQYKGKE